MEALKKYIRISLFSLWLSEPHQA